MTYFADLSPYSYSDWPEEMANVGWLDKDHEFKTCKPDPTFLAKLEILVDQSTNIMRGMHNCQFCNVVSPIFIGNTEPIYKRPMLGSGEIHVRDTSGVLYSAPTLLYHYVKDHHYCPPAVFVEAVKTRA